MTIHCFTTPFMRRCWRHVNRAGSVSASFRVNVGEISRYTTTNFDSISLLTVVFAKYYGIKRRLNGLYSIRVQNSISRVNVRMVHGLLPGYFRTKTVLSSQDVGTCHLAPEFPDSCCEKCLEQKMSRLHGRQGETPRKRWWDYCMCQKDSGMNTLTLLGRLVHGMMLSNNSRIIKVSTSDAISDNRHHVPKGTYSHLAKRTYHCRHRKSKIQRGSTGIMDGIHGRMAILWRKLRPLWHHRCSAYEILLRSHIRIYHHLSWSRQIHRKSIDTPGVHVLDSPYFDLIPTLLN